MSPAARRALAPACVVAATIGLVVGVAIERAEAAEHGGHHEAVLGVELESWPLVTLGVAASLLVALALWRRPGARPVATAAAVVCAAFAILDVAEVARKLDAGEAGIALLAAGVGALHLAAAVLALRRGAMAGA